MSEATKLANLITRVMDGDPWHGSSAVSLLDGSIVTRLRRRIPSLAATRSGSSCST